ncbi:MAG: 3-keto-5-aminohexanoate cleavage protein [Alphaproteobacteria bacterium]|nr:3-keto-5-aminohexanoate cleavage protein [Alphaproteobacteria bacterium]
MTPLPSLMIAPNGARKTKEDHPHLPMTIPEIVAEAVAAKDAGADGLHLHVRDAEGRHSIDVDLYRAALDALNCALPGFAVQVTSESAGIYKPAEQIAMVDALQPALVSVALREMIAEGDVAGARAAYGRWAEAGIAVQHIVYSPEDLDRLIEVLAPESWDGVQIIVVLGRYTDGQESDPADLDAFLERIDALPQKPDWGICAFGRRETACLVAAHKAGGKLRVGFENNDINADGSRAACNADRVRDVLRAIA